jgi:hypothetical protein
VRFIFSRNRAAYVRSSKKSEKPRTSADPVSSTSLRFVQSFIGVIQDFEHGCVTALFGDSRTESHGDADTIELERGLRANLPQLFGACQRCDTSSFRQHDAEFLSTISCQTLFASYTKSQKVREFAQNEVTCEMAIAVIDDLEVIDVEEDHRKRSGSPSTPTATST